MAEPLLPLFPLEVVLLPGTPMPLHIFEERYKDMIGEAIRNKTEFGVVQAGEKGIVNIGCTATVEQVVNRHADGRMDIVVVGRRRFEIFLLDEEKAYLRAAVAFFDDEEAEPAPVELRAMAVAGLKALRAAEEKELEVTPEYTDPHLSFKIAWFIPELSLRQTLLSLRSETERLRYLAEFLPEYVAKIRRITHVRKVAPRNGHGFIRLEERDAEERNG
jgi:Lon protease-like protein